MNVGIIDFGIGNLKSIIHILKKIYLNIDVYLINQNFKNFDKIDKIILPGQGSNYSWIKNFLNFKLEELNKIIVEKPVFGICVGEHVFFQNTTEFESIGIGYLKGFIEKIKIDKNIYKVPNIGWNKVLFLKKHFLFNNILNFGMFYFSHSFYLNSKNNNFIYGLTKYNFYYATVIIKNNLLLTQFHPEKSCKQGFNLFYNFCNWKI